MDSCRCVTQPSDCKFLLKIIDSVTKLLDKTDVSGDGLNVPITFSETVTNRATIEFTLKGKMIFIYGMVTGERLPNHYTAADIKLINEIWDYLDHPENKIIL